MKLVLDMVARARPENAVARGTFAMAIEGAGDAFNRSRDRRCGARMVSGGAGRLGRSGRETVG